jgi:hypothetical protein
MEPLRELRDRLHRGDHLAVAAEYLSGRLSYDRSNWRQASLVGLAMRHHLEALDKSGASKIGFEAHQYENGLAVTLEWPEATEIDQAVLTVEVIDANGDTRFIEEPFVRAEASSGLTARLRASTLTSQQTVHIRPLDEAAWVEVAVQAGHCLRFDTARLTPTMRWSQAGEAARERKSIRFRPVREPERRRVNVYGEFQANNPTAQLEIVTEQQILEEVRQRKRDALKHRWRWFVGIGVAFMSVVALIRKAITPEWIRESLAEPDKDLSFIVTLGQNLQEEQRKREALILRWGSIARIGLAVSARIVPQQAHERHARAKQVSRAVNLLAFMLAVSFVSAVLFALTLGVRLLPRAGLWLFEWLPFAAVAIVLSEGATAPDAARIISAVT